VSALVQSFTRQLTDATLPEVHQQMSSYKERGRDTNTINMAIFSMANKKKCRKHIDELRQGGSSQHEDVRFWPIKRPLSESGLLRLADQPPSRDQDARFPHTYLAGWTSSGFYSHGGRLLGFNGDVTKALITLLVTT
jgi:hypothetical protein